MAWPPPPASDASSGVGTDSFTSIHIVCIARTIQLWMGTLGETQGRSSWEGHAKGAAAKKKGKKRELWADASSGVGSASFTTTHRWAMLKKKVSWPLQIHTAVWVVRCRAKYLFKHSSAFEQSAQDLTTPNGSAYIECNKQSCSKCVLGCVSWRMK